MNFFKPSKPLSLFLGIAASSIPSSTASDHSNDCHSSCGSCRPGGQTYDSPLMCLTCADGSNVTTVQDDQYGNRWGFCGNVCSLCSDGDAPAYSENAYYRGNQLFDEGWSNCSSEVALVPWPVKEDSAECAWAQTQTYLACGCPSRPAIAPLFDQDAVALFTSESEADEGPGHEDGEKCTLCADGSDPANADATVFFHGYAETTCGLLAEAFGHPSMLMLAMGGDDYTAGDSFDCSIQQHHYYELCGCPEPEAHAEACTLCEGGAPVESNYSAVEFRMHFDSEEDAGNGTCAGAAAFVPFLGYKNDTLECMHYREAASEMCGCGTANDTEEYTVNATYPGSAPVAASSMSSSALDGVTSLVLWGTAAAFAALLVGARYVSGNVKAEPLLPLDKLDGY